MHSTHAFRRALRKAQRTADDNANGLALLVFRIGTTNVDSERVAQLVQVLSNRIRVTDDIGWLDGQRIGVLLRFTCLEGGKVVAGAIRGKLAAQNAVVRTRVFAYPDSWSQSSSDAGGSL